MWAPHISVATRPTSLQMLGKLSLPWHEIMASGVGIVLPYSLQAMALAQQHQCPTSRRTNSMRALSPGRSLKGGREPGANRWRRCGQRRNGPKSKHHEHLREDREEHEHHVAAAAGPSRSGPIPRLPHTAQSLRVELRVAPAHRHHQRTRHRHRHRREMT